MAELATTNPENGSLLLLAFFTNIDYNYKPQDKGRSWHWNNTANWNFYFRCEDIPIKH